MDYNMKLYRFYANIQILITNASRAFKTMIRLIEDKRMDDKGYLICSNYTTSLSCD